MPLPEFDSHGDLPAGVHEATLAEVLERFGHGTPQRRLVTARLERIYELAQRTGKLERFVIYGSYVTAKLAPNDVDIILIRRDDFLLPECDAETSPVFHHLQAQAELGASVFWTAPAGILLETVDQFMAGWQITRDQSRGGIVEVTWERAR
jgi:hypothetical protein